MTVEITQEQEGNIILPSKVKFNGESIGDLLKSKEILWYDNGPLLHLTFRITEIK